VYNFLFSPWVLEFIHNCQRFKDQICMWLRPKKKCDYNVGIDENGRKYFFLIFEISGTTNIFEFYFYYLFLFSTLFYTTIVYSMWVVLKIQNIELDLKYFTIVLSLLKFFIFPLGTRNHSQLS
jgi:hypothetical protein